MIALDLLFTVWLAAVSCGLGAPLVSKLDSGRALSAPLHWASAFGLGALGLHFAVWGVGYFRFDTTSMLVLAAAASILAVPGLRQLPARALAPLAAALASDRERPFAIFLWLVIAGFAVSGLLGGLAPPADFDGLQYHLTLPKRDLELGRITTLVGNRVFDFFPALMEMLYRLALATADEGAAQMAHGLFGLAAALGTYGIVRMARADHVTGLLAAVMYLAIRNVVWEFGTTHNELALSAYAVCAFAVYAQWRESRGVGLAVLLGALIGGMCMVKYLGLAVAIGFGVVMAADTVMRRPGALQIWWAPLVALLVFLPLALRNYAFTGNPIMPGFMWVFGDFPRPPADAGPAKDLWGFVRIPWDIFILGSQKYDGQQFGAPYLLVFMPFAALAGEASRRFGFAAVIAVFYLLAWYFGLPTQIRFLSPLFPLFAAAAAIGAVALWQRLPAVPIVRGGFVALALVLGLNQALFVGVYSLIRLPAAFGLVDKETYLTRTPTMSGAHYPACRFVSENLGAGERYLSLLALRSFYCPQVAGIYDVLEDERRVEMAIKHLRWALPTPDDFAERLAAAKVRFVVVSTGWEGRDPKTFAVRMEKLDISGRRFGREISRAIVGLEPVFVGPRTLVFDGPQVIEQLRRQAR